MLQDKIEILPVQLLNTERTLVEEMRQVGEELHLGLGWHYLLDLPWAAQQIGPTPGMRVVDAGAGTGIIQWWLAGQGVDVISVDRMSRRNLPIRFRQQYRTQGWRKQDLSLLPDAVLRGFLPPRSPRHWHLYPRKLALSLQQWRWKPQADPSSGTVFIYNQDLASIPDIPDNSADGVVSISALEHNSPDKLRDCVAELVRVLKPGGKLIATLAAAKKQDWFHEPSKGWCYTEATLRDIFDLAADCPSNYDRYDELSEALRDCAELRDGLADLYFESGNNGMPWGIWDPKYQPVGVIKVKHYER
ncbi:MAG: methyltransferase domain-containing protein [Chloroflexota bacterium]|nr:methyltransferase domain-containing protein [Chloroflexota bacterium]